MTVSLFSRKYIHNSALHSFKCLAIIMNATARKTSEWQMAFKTVVKITIEQQKYCTLIAVPANIMRRANWQLDVLHGG